MSKQRLVLLLALALVLGSERAWASDLRRVDEESGALEHVPARLSFPPSGASLNRESHTFGQNPYTPEAASVSYGVPGHAVVVVIIVPERDPSATAEKLFAARTLLFRNQNTKAVPIDLSRISASCSRTGPGTRIAAFDLEATQESFYVTALAGHLLYVRTTELRREGGPVGTLVAFLAAMEWPCRGEKHARSSAGDGLGGDE